MLNYETLLSNYDDRITLLEYLKKVEAALADASATSFSVTKTGNATIKFVLTFADGSTLESHEIVLQQGESVASAAIVNNHLLLTLTNGDVLDAGDLFNGNVNVAGNITATGSIKQLTANYSSNINLYYTPVTGLTWTTIYNKVTEINGVLYIVVSFKVENTTGSDISLYLIANAEKTLPNDIAGKIYDIEGNTLLATPAANVGVANFLVTYSPTNATNASTPVIFYCAVYNPPQSGSIGVTIGHGNGIAVPANSTRMFSGRIALTLL